MNGGHHGHARMVVEILLKVAIITINQPTIYRCQCLPELDMTCVCVTCPIGCTSNFTPSKDGSSVKKNATFFLMLYITINILTHFKDTPWIHICILKNALCFFTICKKNYECIKWTWQTIQVCTFIQIIAFYWCSTF